ncbi:MAG: hypothetical protein ACUVRV_06500 [Cyanobacteriota bacterium]
MVDGDLIIFSSDVAASYYTSANLRDEEFARYTEQVDFRSVKPEISDPHKLGWSTPPSDRSSPLRIPAERG